MHSFAAIKRRTRLVYVALSTIVAMMAPVGSAWAQAGLPIPSTDAQKSPAEGDTLASAIRALPRERLGGARLLLAVGAETVKPAHKVPLDASQEPTSSDSDPLAALCARYHRTFFLFDDIGAFPPAKMTVLGLPKTPTMSAASVSLPTALNVFLSMLTPDQLRSLSADGLDPHDLTSDQREFYTNILARPLSVAPSSMDPFAEFRSSEESIAALRAYKAHVQYVPQAQFRSATRMHAYLCASYWFRGPGDHGRLSVESDPKYVDTRSDFTLSFYTPPSVRDSNINPVLSSVRSMTDTVLKAGDLDWDRQELAGALRPGACKTAGELVTAAARRSGLELYCDPRFANRSLTFCGEADGEYPAARLLRALTVSVCGAWRKVGPAYVLTNDVAGVGFRRAAIREAAAPWVSKVQDASARADDTLDQNHLADLLTFRKDDPLSTPTAALRGDRDDDGMVETTFGALPADLQKELRKRLRKEVMETPEKPVDTDDPAPFLRGEASQIYQSVNSAFPVHAELGMQIVLDIPSVGSVSLSSDEATLPLNNPADTPAVPDENASSAVPARSVGIMAAPTSPEEARALVDLMAENGVKTFYCLVFTNGMTYFPCKTVPPASEHAGVLQAAVDEGKKRGVAVVAALDFMQWNTDTPRSGSFDWSHLSAPDITITGRTATDAMALSMPKTDTAPAGDFPALVHAQQSGGWPSIIDPRTRLTLSGLAVEIANVPGVAGVLFCKSCPPGYAGATATTDLNPIALGYNEAMRLNYLRSRHLDPIDISDPQSVRVSLDEADAFGLQSASTRIPEYDSPGDEMKYCAAWSEYRAKIWTNAMADVFTAVKKTAPSLPLSVCDGIVGLSVYPWTSAQIIPIMPDDDDKTRPAAIAKVIPVGAFVTPEMLTAAVQLSPDEPHAVPVETLIFDLNSVPVKRDLLAEVKALANTFDFHRLPRVVPQRK